MTLVKMQTRVIFELTFILVIYLSKKDVAKLFNVK